MNKLLFVHDGPIYYDDNGKFYEVSYHGLLERYQYIANDITFLMRVEPVSEHTRNTLVPEKVHVIGVPNFKNPRIYFKYIKRVRKIIKKAVKNTDCLVLRGGSCSNIALQYAKKYDKPYIYECVGCTWDSLWNYSLLGKIMAPSSFLAERRRIKEAPYVCYVTGEFLQRRYPTKGKSVSCSNVVVHAADPSILTKRLERIKRSAQKQKYVLGTAAAIDVRYKGQEYVMKAIGELVKEGYDFEYYLAGGNRLNSTYLKELAQKLNIEERIHFTGSLDSLQILEFYDSIDIYVQPSKQEGLPRAVIEAMSRGIPAIGTNIAGIPELLQRENLFRKGSVKSVKKALKHMVNADLSRYAEENFEKAKEYRIDVLTNRRNKFYDEFLAARKQEVKEKGLT